MRNTLFGLDDVSPHDEGQAYLCTVYDPTELPVVLGILDGAKIPFLIKDRGAGGVSKVIMGFSLYGTDIFVPEEVLDEAVALITVDEEENLDTAENGDTAEGTEEE